MKPERIFIVRHGQSIGNVDKSVYKDTPDYAIQLTDKGKQQALDIGTKLKEIISEETVQFYVSPMWRTRQTYAYIRKSFPSIYPDIYKYYEDPRLREQEWGMSMEGYRHKLEEYRDSYGHFYYRFRDGGESCADVFDRASDFLNTMHRDFEKRDFPHNAIVVTHGMTMRLFLMRWFHSSVEEFESWGNPQNCGHFRLDLQSDGKYKLMTPLRIHKIRHEFQFKPDAGDKGLFPIDHPMPYEKD